MSNTNPILEAFLNQFGSVAASVTADQFTAFLAPYLADSANFKVAGSTATGLYSGDYASSAGDAPAYQMMQDLVARSGGQCSACP